MSSEPEVSVVIPTYNRPNRLRRALDSIENQTYGNLETIVVDDHSDKEMHPITQDYSSSCNIRHLRHEENRGANAARNSGIETASGDFIAFLDDDDTWEPKKIEKQVSTAQESEAGVVYTGIKHIGSGGETLQETIPDEVEDITTKLLYKNVVGSFSTVMVDADTIEVAGLPDESFPIWQDKEWYVRLSQHCSFTPVSELLVNHHRGGESRISENFDSIEEALPKFLNKFEDEIEQRGVLTRRRIYSENFFNAARYGLATGNFDSSRKYAIKSAKYHPMNYMAVIAFLLSLRNGLFYSVYQKRSKQN